MNSRRHEYVEPCQYMKRWFWLTFKGFRSSGDRSDLKNQEGPSLNKVNKLTKLIDYCNSRRCVLASPSGEVRACSVLGEWIWA